MNRLLLLLVFFSCLAEAETIRFPAGNIVLKGDYLPPRSATGPAVLLLHDCDGLYQDGLVRPQMQRMSDMLQEMGYATLMIDSFGPRGIKNGLCKDRKKRRANPGLRANDAQHAIAWLKARREIESGKIAVLGWGQGASSVLELLKRREPGVRSAVAFYPDCSRLRSQKNFMMAAPTLLLVGDADKSAPSALCHELVKESGQSLFHLVSYPEAPHDFDAGGTGPAVSKAKSRDEKARADAILYARQDSWRRSFKWISRWFDPERGLGTLPAKGQP